MSLSVRRGGLLNRFLQKRQDGRRMNLKYVSVWDTSVHVLFHGVFRCRVCVMNVAKNRGQKKTARRQGAFFKRLTSVSTSIK